MTNEELDRARVNEAIRAEAIRAGNGVSVALLAARLAREGWTPPVVVVDPDEARAEHIWETTNCCRRSLNIGASAVFEGIKQGRALAAEAKPGIVWVKHDRSAKCPVDMKHLVLIAGYNSIFSMHPVTVTWGSVDYYAEITPPENVA